MWKEQSWGHDGKKKWACFGWCWTGSARAVCHVVESRQFGVGLVDDFAYFCLVCCCICGWCDLLWDGTYYKKCTIMWGDVCCRNSGGVALKWHAMPRFESTLNCVRERGRFWPSKLQQQKPAAARFSQFANFYFALFCKFCSFPTWTSTRTHTAAVPLLCC